MPGQENSAGGHVQDTRRALAVAAPAQTTTADRSTYLEARGSLVAPKVRSAQAACKLAAA
ncbi:hypothetical protein [Saccharopolyspora gregorii]|uniref:hypothetical protein n=1 Tax=Saccharopolyspora gregorii TaxID=33914 RepID=UPI0031E7FD4B